MANVNVMAKFRSCAWRISVLRVGLPLSQQVCRSRLSDVHHGKMVCQRIESIEPIFHCVPCEVVAFREIMVSYGQTDANKKCFGSPRRSWKVAVFKSSVGENSERTSLNVWPGFG
jgi:hypothetical protein